MSIEGWMLEVNYGGELLDTVPCSECGELTTDPRDCEHDRTQCPKCWESLACVQCANPRSHR